MPFPTFILGPSFTLLGWVRDRHQSRRRVKLTVHRAHAVAMPVLGAEELEIGEENFYINITNASHDRDIVVTHVWLDTVPPLQVLDPALPVRLKYSAPWETAVPVADVPENTTDVEWLARCQVAPDDKIIKSRPRRNVPPFGAVPRG